MLAEVPGLVLESDFVDANDVVMTPPPPTLEEQAERALNISHHVVSYRDHSRVL